MTNLSIDGKAVIIKSGSTIKLIRENTLFTEGGDYTFDVTLPLDGCPQNLRVFGLRHRPEVRLDDLCGLRLPFVLTTDAIQVEGTAVVTSITQDEAKVQLLAAASALNEQTTMPDGTDRYIDEMDLGCAYAAEYPDAYKDGDRFIGDKPYTLSPRDKLRQWVQDVATPDQIYGGADKTDCVLFPIYSTADSGMANERGLRRFFDTTGAQTREVYKYPHTSFGGIMGDEAVFAAQPYLIAIIERVLYCLGYTVRRNDVRGTWMENIFIANSRSEYKFANVLPHWTAKEFFDEVRRFLGIAIVVTEPGVADIIRRHYYYRSSADVVCLNEVIDEHSADIDDDEEGGKDVSTANVDYDNQQTDDMMRLPDEVWENAIVKTFSTETILVRWAAANIPEEKRRTSAWLLVDQGAGHTFAYLRSAADNAYYMAQVDCCPPLIRGGNQYAAKGRDIGVTLRIVPAKMEMINATYIKSTFNGRTYDNEIQEGCMPVPTLVTADMRCTVNEVYSVDAAINEASSSDDNTTDERPDVITVALNTGTLWHYAKANENPRGPSDADIPVPLGIAYVKNDDGFYIPIIGAGNRDHFNLTNRQSPSLRADALDAGLHIDTRCLHTFAFTDDLPQDVFSVFLIRNRRYICQKMECDIDEDGVRPLKRGYFYELNEEE